MSMSARPTGRPRLHLEPLEPLEPPDRYIPAPLSFDPNDVFWKTREGEVMAVVDMTDTHMENCMRMMLRQREEIYWKYVMGELEFMDGPLGPQGDMAQDAANEVVDDLARMTPLELLRRHYPPFVAMHNELRARKCGDTHAKTHEEYMDEVYADITERSHQFGHD